MYLTPELNQQIFQIVLNIISVISAIGAYYGVQFIRSKIDSEKLVTIEQIALEAVKFAEQQGLDLGKKGEEKLVIACLWMSARLKEKGINVSPDKIKGFVKIALRTIKDEFGDEWAK